MEHEAESTLEAKRCVRILEANYKKEDLPSVVKDNCKHLSLDKQAKLLELSSYRRGCVPLPRRPIPSSFAF